MCKNNLILKKFSMVLLFAILTVLSTGWGSAAYGAFSIKGTVTLTGLGAFNGVSVAGSNGLTTQITAGSGGNTGGYTFGGLTGSYCGVITPSLTG